MRKEILFRLATLQDKSLIQAWWTKPHVMAFWDNSDAMWQNVENYLQGKKDLFDYWIGYLNDIPYALLMTSEVEKTQPSDSPYSGWVDASGVTMSIDFMIGEEDFLGKGLGHLTLIQFSEFLRGQGVHALIIDPAANNSRAVRVYQKAGFEMVATFDRLEGYFAGVKHCLMKKQL